MLSGIIVIVWMSAFIAAWVWAWQSKRRPDFEAAARLACEPNEAATTNADEVPR